MTELNVGDKVRITYHNEDEYTLVSVYTGQPGTLTLAAAEHYASGFERNTTIEVIEKADTRGPVQRFLEDAKDGTVIRFNRLSSGEPETHTWHKLEGVWYNSRYPDSKLYGLDGWENWTLRVEFDPIINNPDRLIP